jgi:hypothetical protein
MEVDPISGTINVSKLKSTGTYTIKIVGILPDLASTSS